MLTRPTDRPTDWDRQTDRLKQTDRPTDRLRETDRPTDRHDWGRQTDRLKQTDRPTDRLRQTDRPTDRHDWGRQTDRLTDRLIDRQTGRPTDRPTNRQTDRKTNIRNDRQVVEFSRCFGVCVNLVCCLQATGALGEVMLSLGYLRLTERLTVVIISARNLCSLEEGQPPGKCSWCLHKSILVGVFVAMTELLCWSELNSRQQIHILRCFHGFTVSTRTPVVPKACGIVAFTTSLSQK